MIKEIQGKVVKGLGGLYEVRYLGEGGRPERISLRAKGNLRRDDSKLLIGDDVTVTLDDSTPDGIVISAVSERKNSLIRPPLANLDYIFIVFAARKPDPVTETVDKLIAIAEDQGITPVIVITKTDLDSESADYYYSIYSSAGFKTFITSSERGEGIDALSQYISDNLRNGKCAAFAGASGVGKSTLMNTLFPTLSLATADISRKIERGRHTTRHVEIFDITDDGDSGLLADTPGFSLIDFSRFDFFPIERLLPAFRDIACHSEGCRYADCAHVDEDSSVCAVARAAEEGAISSSRLESYRSIYRVLKAKKEY